MDKLLHFLLENSIYAVIAAAVVLLARLALRRAPKVFSYMLWAVVFFRLICPLSLHSGISIIPDITRLQSGRAVSGNQETSGEPAAPVEDYPAAVDSSPEDVWDEDILTEHQQSSNINQ